MKCSIVMLLTQQKWFFISIIYPLLSKKKQTSLHTHPIFQTRHLLRGRHGIFRQSFSLIQYVVLSVRLFVYPSVQASFLVVA